ncbi:outer dynein arm-docking complex subunit 4-like [Babylonia areolata]|uniref:outer dynein arm-docking complex subunit 4-like n=1 Tax=Babylonia areolata TaxID=304850 RepID=UPI003FD0A07D
MVLQALHLIPTDFDCLLKRAHCYLNMVFLFESIENAFYRQETPTVTVTPLMGFDPKTSRLRDFENALICYHRGRCHRPLDNAIAVGIHKSQEAINNSIGTRKSVRLCATGDLSYFNEGLPMCLHSLVYMRVRKINLVQDHAVIVSYRWIV